MRQEPKKTAQKTDSSMAPPTSPYIISAHVSVERQLYALLMEQVFFNKAKPTLKEVKVDYSHPDGAAELCSIDRDVFNEADSLFSLLAHLSSFTGPRKLYCAGDLQRYNYARDIAVALWQALGIMIDESQFLVLIESCKLLSQARGKSWVSMVEEFSANVDEDAKNLVTFDVVHWASLAPGALDSAEVRKHYDDNTHELKTRVNKTIDTFLAHLFDLEKQPRSVLFGNLLEDDLTIDLIQKVLIQSGIILNEQQKQALFEVFLTPKQLYSNHDTFPAPLQMILRAASRDYLLEEIAYFSAMTVKYIVYPGEISPALEGAIELSGRDMEWLHIKVKSVKHSPDSMKSMILSAMTIMKALSCSPYKAAQIVAAGYNTQAVNPNPDLSEAALKAVMQQQQQKKKRSDSPPHGKKLSDSPPHKSGFFSTVRSADGLAVPRVK